MVREPGLTADSVSFAYGPRRRAGGATAVLNEVSARVPRGGLVGILGPNGSGKTDAASVAGRLAASLEWGASRSTPSISVRSLAPP